MTCDRLINNLGVYERKPFEAISDQEWWQITEPNFMSGVHLSRHYQARANGETNSGSGSGHQLNFVFQL
jgi:short-subunit dehydrogenase